MQETQRIYGYLPKELLERMAKALDVPLEELYSTATFYSQFSFVPKGEYTISICMGTACYVKGAGDILDDLSDILKIKCTCDLSKRSVSHVSRFHSVKSQKGVSEVDQKLEAII